ncbi:hypothetical protein ABZ916_15655 [Streptomyces sp. NPDC046853]|uniref:hypothetical protein n=1 Tax=Streptomyces sp. NPDC046853 TaxID=3154920 RepID=UPI00340BB11E
MSVSVIDEVAETPEQSLHLPEPADDRLRTVTDLLHADPGRAATLTDLAFAAWITELMHNAGDASHEGEFRKQTARAELQRQFTSPAASQLFSELTSGVN